MIILSLKFLNKMEVGNQQSLEKFQALIVSSLQENHQKLVEKLSKDHVADLAEVIADQALLFRFLKKYKFLMEDSNTALIAHMDWRINENLYHVSLENSPPATIAYLKEGLLRFFKTDKLGRPVAYITPRIFIPNTVETTGDLKTTLILCMETLKRWIYSMSDNLKRKDLVSQALIIVNLDGFGVSNMDYGLIPLVYDLFRYQYPQLLGQVLILNYGWVHAGLWGVISPLLTAEARQKLVFLDQKNLTDYIDPANIPSVFGGKEPNFPISYNVCPVFQSFASPIQFQHRNPALQQMVALLAQNGLESPLSLTSSSEDVYFDAQSDLLGKSVKSTADLQLLLPSHTLRGSGLGRAHSTASLSSLARRNKSHLNLSLSNSKSHTSLAKFYNSPAKQILSKSLGSVSGRFNDTTTSTPTSAVSVPPKKNEGWLIRVRVMLLSLLMRRKILIVVFALFSLLLRKKIME